MSFFEPYRRVQGAVDIITNEAGDQPRAFSYYENAEKEAQETSWRGSGGVPQLQKSPKIGGFRGLIETISAVSLYKRVKRSVDITTKEEGDQP